MNKPISRGVALAVGTLVLFINGIVYAWSIYSAPFSENFGWTSAQLGVCFTIVLIMFCVGGLVGSMATQRFGSGRTITLGGLAAALGYTSAVAREPMMSVLVPKPMSITPDAVPFLSGKRAVTFEITALYAMPEPSPAIAKHTYSSISLSAVSSRLIV